MKGNSLTFRGMRGKVGGFVVTQAPDGQSIVKSAPSQVSQPNTEGQVNQKSRFGYVVRMAVILIGFIRAWFRPTSVVHSGFNAFVKHNLGVLVQGSSDNHTEFLQQFRFSQGPLYRPGFFDNPNNLTHYDDGQVFVDMTWGYSATSEVQDGNDLLTLLVYNDTTGDWNEIPTNVKRSVAAYNAPVPVGEDGLRVVVAFFRNAANTQCSNSFTVCKVDGGVLESYLG